MMKHYSLDELVEREKAGIIFAKITKSYDSKNVHGSYFDYKKYEGRGLDKTVDTIFEQSSIEPLDIAFGYFHYGDQITIVNFSKIKSVGKTNY